MWYCVVFCVIQYPRNDNIRLNTVKSKNTMQFYIIKSLRINGKPISKIVEKLGNLEQITGIIGPDAAPYEWGRKRALQLTQEEDKTKLTLNIPYSNNKRIEKDQAKIYNCGYLFIKKIFYELKLDLLAKEIAAKYKIDFDLLSIIHDLICLRIIFPSSKLNSFEESKEIS